ncbi:Ribosomal small subunit Rsm22 [Chthoniobacter flavus Ellin428]|uniref:Ribosomal small subunit Rsm22 n=1 Tax=Chthoniobacter flavus Ellin428 TaxID=497964 RepID=B4CUH0_9BACT|nr:small ribosomal subunit Rsm22 family protein [Chthoniobacter flavus]EDY22208.1 Ribosomal small subunit Rsm22 [Chthoniobacter flavus Ellin428]TCO94764.1 small ribosomal subunit Rsm22 [Chthoniobacter flavus]
MIKHFSPHDLGTLRAIRERFLAGTAGSADYWQSPEHLALYDSTYAERIGWKWDAVLDELRRRGWQSRCTRVLDWGCGTGIAHRRVLTTWPQFPMLALHDRSPHARMFAAEKARREFPEVDVTWGAPSVTSDTLLLVSHVINELPEAELARLLELARAAREVIWVEAGTHVDSRRLIEVRERLRDVYTPVAPCTHTARCGMLTAENAAHWCHHFARPPSAIFQDARWAEFAKEIGIDLRSVPYSFLVLARTPAMEAGFSRVIGEPREAKGHAKVLSCQAEGVAEFVLQKRDAPNLFKAMRKGSLGPVYRWEMEGGKIVGGEPGTVVDS